MLPICYLPDASVDAVLDRELRELLSLCFTKPQDVVFKERRYFTEPPAHRWIMRDAAGRLVAHIAVHNRRVEAGTWVALVGGIAEVCVHPEARGQRLTSHLLAEVHADLARRGFLFTALFGDRQVYAASGYTMPGNALVGPDAQGRWIPAPRAMVRPLTDVAWPTGEVHMPGPFF